MKEYFQLQLKRNCRIITEAGVNPFLGALIACTLFIALSIYMFNATSFAPYILVLTCIALLFRMSEKSRNEFIFMSFPSPKAAVIRMLENLIVCTPFVLLLVLKLNITISVFLIGLASIMALISISPFANKLNSLSPALDKSFGYRVLPTPFAQSPFEFTQGFRQTVIFLLIAYVILAIAIKADNYNLGIFSMLLLFLSSFSYYIKPENDFYVWTHSKSPSGFLWHKFKTAIINVFKLNIPIMISLGIFYPEHILITTFAFVLGLVYLITVVIAKYSTYPEEMSVPEGVFLALSISFPPMLLAIFPYYYKKSINKLKYLLNDQSQ